MFTEKALFLTINNKTLRLVITSRSGIGGMVYTRDYEASDLESGCDSYCMYENCFSEDEVKTLLDLYEDGKKAKVINQIKKRLSMPEIQKKKVGPMGEIRLSDRVPDDWFDG